MKDSKYRHNLSGRWYVRTALVVAVCGFIVLACKATGSDIARDLSGANTIWDDTGGKTTAFIWSLAPEGCNLAWYRSAIGTPDLCRAWDKLDALIATQLIIAHFPQYVLIPGLLVGFSGYSLDLLYSRLRRNGAK